MLKIALAQLNTTVGDLAGNTEKITGAIEAAQEKGAQFVVFPELALTGYPPEDLLFKSQFISENLNLLNKIVEKVDGPVVILGFVDRVGGRLYNAAAIIQNRRVVSVYHKALLPNYSVFDEKRYFEPGAKTSVFVMGHIRFGVNICEDIYQPVCPAVNQCVSGGADILFNISASPYFAGKRLEREELLRGLAKRNKVSIVYTNLVSGQDELLFDGYSMVVDHNGEIIASAPQFKEEILYVDMEIPGKQGLKEDTGGKSGLEFPGLQLETVAMPGDIQASLTQKPSPPKRTRHMGRLEEIFNALAFGVCEYVKKNGFSKVLLGLSGGIDSTLVAVIAAEALGPENVIGVTLPSVYSSVGSVVDSEQLARNLSIKLLNIPIASIVESFDGGIYEIFKDTKPGLAEENLQARVRGTILMTLSNKFGWLVLTTGNKSETSVGYCTLYGDMAGGYAVIKDVYKTLVYELAEWFNTYKGREVIPREIIEKEPSAELRPGQKDSDSLPPYDVLDEILLRYVEQHKVLGEIVREGFDRDLVKKVISLVDLNEYKRRQAPPGIKITPHAFGKDRRLPIVNWYRQE